MDVPLEQVKHNRGKIGAGGAVGIGYLLLKFGAALKFILPGLAKAPFLISMIINIGFYALLFSSRMGVAFGIAFGVGFVALLLVHECGHLVAARMEGLRVSLPYFIPFVGALIMLREQPRDARSEAIVGIGGPVAGTVGALACFGIGMTLGPDSDWGLFFTVLSGYGFLLNLFNMIPFHPLDGGRVLSAVSPWFNLVGLVLLVGAFLGGFLHSVVLLLLLFVYGFRTITNFPSMLRAKHYYSASPLSRAAIGLSYLALLAVLVVGMEATYPYLETQSVGSHPAAAGIIPGP